MGSPPYPRRVPLARLPTPLEEASRLSTALGVRLLVKRDDLTGLLETGNKVRKLEFACAAALDERADTLITCGGVQSNHCRATAAVGARLGLRARLLLRGTDLPDPDGNLFLDRLLGAEIRFITREQYRDRARLMAGWAEETRREGRKPFVILEGGSDAWGAWGYVRGLEEILGQAAEARERVDVLVHAAGSGGTSAGLAAGAAWLGFRGTLLGIPVCDDGAYFRGMIQQIAADMARRGWPVEPAPVTFADGYQGPGYGIAYPEEMAWVRRAAREEGLLLDPVYTGKALAGLAGEVAAGRVAKGSTVVFLHTGGAFGALAQRKDYLEGGGGPNS
ncbi:MAG: D-cysteine desulfhydrase family protein [Planctomycetales bacterium]|nr:D-cysteine desulfhydrase family protein [Planctomycetales bacterium]